MQKVKKSVFFVIVVLILALAYLAVFGVYTVYGDITTTVFKGLKEVTLDKSESVSANIVLRSGLDEYTPEQLGAAKKIIEKRLELYGIDDFEVYCDNERGQILVDMKWGAGNTAELNQIRTIISTQGLFEVRLGNQSDISTGKPIGVSETVILNNSGIKSAGIDTSYYSLLGRVSLELGLTRQARADLKAATAKYIEDTSENTSWVVSYWLDGARISTNTFTSALDTNTISPYYSSEDAYNQAVTAYAYLTSGALPIPFTAMSAVVNENPDGTAVYGISAAIFIGILCLLLIIVYKLPGLCAALALILQNVVTVMIMTGFFTDRPVNVMTYSVITAVFIGNMISAYAYAAACNIISAKLVHGNMSVSGAVNAALNKSRAKSLLAYPIMIVVLLVSMLLFNAEWLFKKTVFVDMSRFADFSKHLLFIVIIAFFAMLLFRLMVKALADGKNVVPAAFTSVCVPRVKKSIDRKKLKAAVAIAAVVAIVICGVACAFVGGAYSKQIDGSTVIIKGFDDGDIIENDDFVNAIHELSDRLEVNYGVSTTGVFTMKIVIPSDSEVDAAAVNALISEKYPNTFTAVSTVNTDNLFSAKMLITYGIIALASILVFTALTAIFVTRLPKGKAALSAFVSTLVTALLTGAIVYLVRVPYSTWILMAVLGSAVFSGFAVFSFLCDAEAEMKENKRMPASDAVLNTRALSRANITALGIILLFACAGFIVMGLVVSAISAVYVGVVLACIAVVGLAVSALLGSSVNA